MKIEGYETIKIEKGHYEIHIDDLILTAYNQYKSRGFGWKPYVYDTCVVLVKNGKTIMTDSGGTGIKTCLKQLLHYCRRHGYLKDGGSDSFSVK